MPRRDRVLSEGTMGRRALRAEGRCIFSGRKCPRARWSCEFNEGRGGAASKVDLCAWAIQWGISSCRCCPNEGECERFFRCFLERNG